MIYEVRTYTLATGAVPQYEESFARAMHHREKYSKLTAYWHTEIGPLNQVVHIWAYDDLAHRAKVREAVAKEPNWPPAEAHLIQHMESEIVVPAPFMRPIEPGHYGNIYEMRIYDCQPWAMPEIMKRWGEKIPGREKYSPCLACGYTELGGLNKLIHIWPYESMEERARIRQESVKSGDWPPNTREFILRMQNKILIPAEFSPVK
ncbi:MAG: NIPSNAP family protein [Dehalococcoidia bacterium]